ncbi:MAG: hypothetical protein QM612_01660 [Thermomonas sp.]|uniref:hypothetical protein n=1 Tax=Thermomonas sp. TaxID=1971895 RepID=UPI0039E3DF11
MRELSLRETGDVDGGMANVAVQVGARILIGAAVGTGAGLLIGLAAYVIYESVTD